jgi:hypothetical protein
VLLKPTSKFGHIRRRKLLDSVLYFSNCCHDAVLYRKCGPGAIIIFSAESG